VLADLAKEPVLDGVPLGGSGGIVTDGDRQSVRFDQLFLQRIFPEAAPIAIAAATVG